MDIEDIKPHAFNFEYLEKLPVVAQGHTANLILDSPFFRLWLTRTGYEGIRQAEIELYTGNGWQSAIIITQMYECGEWINCPASVLLR